MKLRPLAGRPGFWRGLLALGCLAGGVAFGAAESELMQLQGLSREELLRRLGPPLSTASAGDRELLSYPQARLTLRQGVVVEVALPAPGAAATARAAAPSSTVSASAVAPPPAAPTQNPATSPAVSDTAEEKPASKSPAARWTTTAVLLAIVAAGAAALRVWPRRRKAAPASEPAPEPTASAMAPEKEAPPAPAPARIALPARVFTALDARLLDELEWKRFEDLVAAFFGASGFVAKLTPAGADGGVDIHLHRDGGEKPVAYVQCKSWRTQDVGVKTVRELYGVMVADGVMEAHLAAAGGFTAEAKQFAAGKNLHLVDGDTLIARFNQLPEAERRRILAAVTAGDYTTPTCPSCDVKLVLRGEDKSFWGCPRYPRCRHTLIARRAA